MQTGEPRIDARVNTKIKVSQTITVYIAHDKIQIDHG